jgi:hypothetical protein
MVQCIEVVEEVEGCARGRLSASRNATDVIARSAPISIFQPSCKGVKTNLRDTLLVHPSVKSGP